MADNVQRVGLVFKEDGSADFVKSLRLVNAQLKENYENFKLTQAQWDKSTTTTQKLKDRLVYLNEAYDIQKSKVSTLKAELGELEGAENKDEVAIQKKRAALSQAETSLQKYQNQIDEVTVKLKTGSEAIKDYGKKVEENGHKIEDAGKKLSLFSGATVAAITASVKGAIDFESAFTGVSKTVDATDEQLAELKVQIREMAKEIPSSTTEIAGVAEAAGQLGIKTENIVGFSKAMIDLGNSTNLGAEEAASQLAKFANITQMSQKDFDKLGSAIVDLGNHFATTEADIVNMAMRLAVAGHQVGLSQGQILGLSTALSSVGIEAEMGGSAMSKAMIKMQNAVELGGDKMQAVLKKANMSLHDIELMSANDSKSFKALATSLDMTSTELKNMITAGTNLEDFAKISGMSAEQFKKAWKDDAAGALTAFIKGLGKAEDKGESAITLLSEMGLTEVRLRDSLLRAANAGDLFNDAIETGTKAWNENVALTNEANKRYGTLESQLKIALNRLKDMGITIGEKLMPTISNLLGKFEDWTNKFEQLDQKQVETIVKLGLLVGAMAPVISTTGKIVTGTGQMIQAYGQFRESLGLMIAKAEASGSSMSGLLGIIEGMTSPIGIAGLAIAGSIAGIEIAAAKANAEVKNDFETMGNSASNFITGIDGAKSHLDSFNSTIFASAEEQEKLKQNMQEIQSGITTICKTATDERRGYTQEEITQLDEYFTKLRELKDREIQIQSEVATAITQQATTNAESFQGSLEEYKTQSQEWINTALQQKDATVALIEQGSIEEVALLNQRYQTQEERQSEAYQNEYNNIMEQKQTKINEANDEVAKVCEAYSNGYTQRIQQNDSFFGLLQDYNKRVEEENTNHNSNIDRIENDGLLTQYNKNKAKDDEEYRHKEKTKKIWQEMYKNMSDEQASELGVWLAQVSQTEMYGGQVSDENKRMVDEILASYDSMPEGTRNSMKNAMAPMLDEMEKKEPSLFAKAKGIADGILARLNKSFDIHSPSRKTRKIFQLVMKGAELGLEDEEKKLYNEADDIAKNVSDKLEQTDATIDPSISSGHSKNETNIINAGIDYEKLYKIILKALNSFKIVLDKDGFIHLIDDRLMEVI